MAVKACTTIFDVDAFAEGVVGFQHLADGALPGMAEWEVRHQWIHGAV
jgi:hypothetical protein